jgi:hypothetical protein
MESTHTSSNRIASANRSAPLRAIDTLGNECICKPHGSRPKPACEDSHFLNIHRDQMCFVSASPAPHRSNECFACLARFIETALNLGSRALHTSTISDRECHREVQADVI